MFLYNTCFYHKYPISNERPLIPGNPHSLNSAWLLHCLCFIVVFFPSGNLHVAPQSNGNRDRRWLSAGYKEVSPTSSHKENSSSLINQLANLPGFNPLKARIVKQYAKTPEEILPTAVEKSLPWRRDRSTYNFGMCLITNEIYIINACLMTKNLHFLFVFKFQNLFLVS